MLKIEAVIRSSTIHDVEIALNEVGIPTFSSYQIQITGIHKGHAGVKNKASDFIPKSKIDIICKDEDEEKIINAIQKAANTGEKGDGIIFSYNLNKLVKIKTAETGADAL